MRRNVPAEGEVSRLWRKHQHADFPAARSGAPLAGVDLVAVDAEITGCIEEWRSAGGVLAPARRQALTRRIEELDTVLPLLTSRAESLYFDRLRRLAAVLNSLVTT